MQTFNSNWSLLDKINFLQRKIILNSILYYEYNENDLDDHYYDSLCVQLVDLQSQYSGSIEHDTTYGYIYYDFTGDTGYHLYERLVLEDRLYLLQLTTIHLDKKGRAI